MVANNQLRRTCIVAVSLFALLCTQVRCSARAAAYFSRDAVARIAVDFCSAAGEGNVAPSRITRPASPGALAADAHHWRPLWHVAMSRGANLQIADVSGIVVGYTAGKRTAASDASTSKDVDQETAIRKAVILLAASGQKNELADSPDIANSPDSAAWVVRWKRVWNSVEYPTDAATVSIDKTTGAPRSLFINFNAPPPGHIEEAITAQEAVKIAESALKGDAGASTLQVLPPEKVVVSLLATASSPAVSRVAWFCHFLTGSGRTLSTYVDIVTGRTLHDGK